MKCPNCKKLNRIGSTNCFYCGTVLTQSEPSWLEEVNKKENNTIYVRPDQFGNVSQASDEREQFAQEMVSLRQGTVEAERIKEERIKDFQRRRMQSMPQNSTLSLEDYKNDPDFKAIAQQGDMQRARQKYSGQESISSTLPSLHAVKDKSTKRIIHSRRFKIKYKLLMIIPIVLVLLALIYGVYSLVYFMNVKKQEIAELSKPIIIPSILNDVAAHTIKIPGEDGQQIYIKELHKNFLVINGYATVEVEDYKWYENYDDYVNESMQVTLTPYIRKTNGKHIPLEPVVFDVDIPLSPLEILNPPNKRDTSYTSIYKIEIKVRKNSKLWINDAEYSDIVNTDNGKVTFNAPIRAIGDNVFRIRCKAQYSRENVQDVIIHRPKQEIPVDLATDISNVSTFPYMTVKASTVPGAYILVQTPHTDLDVTNVDIDGSFSFKAVFNKIGDNDIQFTASKPGLKTTEIKHTVYYVPDIDKYSRVAWAMDDANYNQLINTINERVNASQKYVCIGKIEEIVTSSPQLAIMNCGTEEKPLRIMLENKTKDEWEIGKTYRIYADATGMYRDMPRLTGRYTYVQ